MKTLSPIFEFLNGSPQSAQRLGYAAPELEDAYDRHVLMTLAGGYVEVFGASAEAPAWLPFFPWYLSRSAPNPDTVMGYSPVDAAGTYRISGRKGTETIATVTVREGGAHIGKRPGKRLDEIDLMDLPTDADGWFDFILSPEKPAGYEGLWFAMHPDATMLTKRHVTVTADQIDGTLVIERLDRQPGPIRPEPGEVSAKMETLARFAKEQNEFLLGYVNYLREQGAEDALILDDQTPYGGLVVQAYFFHLFDIAPDEVVILESDVPDARYWNIQVWDPFCTTLDYVSRQSALNSDQLHIDADGRVRVVIAASDPGVANWLDTCGWTNGGLIWRWNDAATTPKPTSRKVKLADLKSELPADTLFADEAHRRDALRKRALLYQQRRK